MQQSRHLRESIIVPWGICLLCTLVVFCGMGMATGGFFPYLPYIQEEGYTATQTSLLITIRCFSSLIVMAGITRYYKLFTLRTGMTLACASLAAGQLIMSFADSYPVYVVGIAVMGIAYSAAGMVPAAMLMGNWFEKSRATAIAVCSIGSALAASVLPAAETALILRYSLRASFRAGALLAIAVLLIFFLIVRDTPEEKGYLPYGVRAEEAKKDDSVLTSPEEKPAGKVRPVQTGGRDLSRAMQACMFCAMLLVGGYAMAAQGHFSVLMISEGYTKEQAAFGFSLMGTVLILGKFVYGRLTDFLGARIASLITLTMLTAGYILCAMPLVSMPVLILRAALIGMGLPICTVGIPVTARELSSAEKYPETLRNYQMGYTTGSMLFSSFPGVLYDRLDNYNVSYAICAAAVVTFLAVLLAAYLQLGQAEKSAG
ncbi:MAG: MFS transporter [Lachnospiraceae bacterium]|nr:MFS transporter [Lachnospiraceae bacterium]